MPRFTASPSAAIKLIGRLCKTGSAAPARFGGLVARLRLLVDYARASHLALEAVLLPADPGS
jgi:hypothetical protein